MYTSLCEMLCSWQCSYLKEEMTNQSVLGILGNNNFTKFLYSLQHVVLMNNNLSFPIDVIIQILSTCNVYWVCTEISYKYQAYTVFTAVWIQVTIAFVNYVRGLVKEMLHIGNHLIKQVFQIYYLINVVDDSMPNQFL